MAFVGASVRQYVKDSRGKSEADSAARIGEVVLAISSTIDYF